MLILRRINRILISQLTYQYSVDSPKYQHSVLATKLFEKDHLKWFRSGVFFHDVLDVLHFGYTLRCDDSQLLLGDGKLTIPKQ